MVAKAHENRVLLVAVHPSNTSRECPKITVPVRKRIES